MWKSLGKIFAAIGKGAVKAALWSSDHPEVIAKVSDIAKQVGAPANVVDKVDAGIAVANDVTNKVKAISGN